MLLQPVRARLDRDGHQVVNVVVDRGYHPDAILARAGLPLRLVFRRDDNDACSERVVFSSPRLNRRLAATGSTTVELPAQPPGEVRFTCGMGRYRGRIELVGEPAPSILVDRARWLVPAVLASVAVGALVLAGVLPLSIVLFAALFGGCALMHVVGHGGHGGHGGRGGAAHAAHDDPPATQGRRAEGVVEDLMPGGSASEPVAAAPSTDDGHGRSHSRH